MNWDLTDEQQEVQSLAATILGGERATWEELAKADLLGLCLPTEHGGGGYGIVELCLILEEQGRAGVHLPILPTIATAMTIAETGTDAERKEWLPRVIYGDAVLTSVLSEEPAIAPYGREAAAILTGDGLRSASELELTDLVTTSGEPQVAVENATPAPEPSVERWLAGLCALQAGISDRALRITAEYTSGREQFGKPIATFQAVAQRAADAYIDAQTVRLTAYQAAWRLAEGLPAHNELAVAKFWAAEAGHRVALATQHLHGGIGMDTDYPLPKYTTWTKHIELTLGSATPSLVRLGRALAEEPV